MTYLLHGNPSTEASDAGLMERERRRLGRIAVNPVLIPLLRAAEVPADAAVEGTHPADLPTDDTAGDAAGSIELPLGYDVLDDGGDPARGLILGLLLSAPVWGGLGLLGYWLFK